MKLKRSDFVSNDGRIYTEWKLSIIFSIIIAIVMYITTPISIHDIVTIYGEAIVVIMSMGLIIILTVWYSIIKPDTFKATIMALLILAIILYIV